MKHNLDHISSLVLIAGISGAGRSTASNVLSDLGFYTIDNLPVDLLSNFLKLSSTVPARFSKTCLLLDIDSAEKLQNMLAFLKKMDTSAKNVKILFLDCNTETVIKRYSETRRPHPIFDIHKDKTLKDAIKRERTCLIPLKDMSHFVVDTSEFNVHDLKRELKEIADTLVHDLKNLIRVNFLSFGFKFGIPLDCDLVIDVRFLPNPYFVEKLREKTGLQKEVSNYVLKTETAKEFVEKYFSLLEFLLPHYVYEGKAHVNIGIGCTGGKHRSVAISKELAGRISKDDYIVSAKHRDIDK